MTLSSKHIDLMMQVGMLGWKAGTNVFISNFTLLSTGEEYVKLRELSMNWMLIKSSW